MAERVVLAAALVAGVASFVLVQAIRRWVERRNILDVPDERSSHTVPTPLGGGIAIVVVTLTGLAALQFAGHLLPSRLWFVLAIGGLVIATVSWLDDLYSVPIWVRFAVHVGAASAMAFVTHGWSEVWLPGAGLVHLGIVGPFIAVTWIAGMTNAYNFMDGLDGIAGLQAVVAGAGWLILSAITGYFAVGAIGALLAGSAAGFLLHNWQPARIFMGDVGSAFIGYLFASIAVIGADADPRLAIAGVLMLWPFVFDTTVTLLRRTLRRERIFSAHKSHFYQRLQQSGLSHAQVSVMYGGLAAVGVICAALMVMGPAPQPSPTERRARWSAANNSFETAISHRTEPRR